MAWVHNKETVAEQIYLRLILNHWMLDVVVKTFAQTISLTCVAMNGQQLQAPFL